ncbi:MAG TPA: glycosyltransferase family A protein, partial [Anaerolineaceae bacterium]|nr:glycosyltransferase family A protein [Anaerolineaceae bacterium]
MTQVDVLLATCNRLPSLVMTLAGLAGQTYHGYTLILADQSDQPVTDAPVIRSVLRILEEQCDHVEYHHRLPSLGIAEQRHYLLQNASA